MFEPDVSREARKRMHEVSLREIVHIQSRTAFSLREEALLNSLQLGSLPRPTRQMMEDLLRTRVSCCTPQLLLDHWHVLHTYSDVPVEGTNPVDWKTLEQETQTLLNDISSCLLGPLTCHSLFFQN
ncbi:hypothetical protein V3C99_018861 [Haemonchus contortus]|uniref:MCRS_N domain-containing protein n=1 Tax=Haemonchus contortus TaxID=6289 RepID=A0A7I4YZE5_HAECO